MFCDYGYFEGPPSRDHAAESRVGRGGQYLPPQCGVGLTVSHGPRIPGFGGAGTQFHIQVPGVEACRPDLVFFNWEHGRDLYVDVVGLLPLALSYRENFVRRDAVPRAASLVAFYCEWHGTPLGLCSNHSHLNLSLASMHQSMSF
jgi:hypothetical protein